jgi:UDP-N-acetylmuramate-alanine ligase
MGLADQKNIYFLGIGGIGMSALARYFNSEGFYVCGYDRTSSVITDQLMQEGIQVFFEDDLSSIPLIEVLQVHTGKQQPVVSLLQFSNNLNFLFQPF